MIWLIVLIVGLEKVVIIYIRDINNSILKYLETSDM